jgi:hypothetical protein
MIKIAAVVNSLAEAVPDEYPTENQYTMCFGKHPSGTQTFRTGEPAIAFNAYSSYYIFKGRAVSKKRETSRMSILVKLRKQKEPVLDSDT